MAKEYQSRGPDPAALWHDAEVLYRAAARATEWCRTARPTDHEKHDRGLRDLLQEALPKSADQRDSIARALEVPAGWLERLTEGGADPVSVPPHILAALARGLRMDPRLFWMLAQRDHSAAEKDMRVTRMFRSASAAPAAPDVREAEHAFRTAWAREQADAPEPGDTTENP